MISIWSWLCDWVSLLAALKHSPSKKKSMLGRTRTQTLNEEIAAQQGKIVEKNPRTISFSDEQGEW